MSEAGVHHFYSVHNFMSFIKVCVRASVRHWRRFLYLSAVGRLWLPHPAAGTCLLTPPLVPTCSSEEESEEEDDEQVKPPPRPAVRWHARASCCRRRAASHAQFAQISCCRLRLLTTCIMTWLNCFSPFSRYSQFNKMHNVQFVSLF